MRRGSRLAESTELRNAARHEAANFWVYRDVRNCLAEPIGARGQCPTASSPHDVSPLSTEAQCGALLQCLTGGFW